MNWWYGNIMSSGARGFLNYVCFHFKTLRPLIFYFWNRTKKNRPVEGVCLHEACEVKKVIAIPVLCTGGFQDGALIRKAISEGSFHLARHCSPKCEMFLGKSLSQRERVARVSGPGEGYRMYFLNLLSFCTPHPPLRGTLSRRERDC
jgi:hypothetical protein